MVSPVGQQLGYGVRLALYLVQLLLLEAQVGVGRQKRREILVRAAEQHPVRLPPPAGALLLRQPCQRGQLQLRPRLRYTGAKITANCAKRLPLWNGEAFLCAF